MPLVFRLVGRGVGKVSGLVQGGRARMNEMSKGSDLLQVGRSTRQAAVPVLLAVEEPWLQPAFPLPMLEQSLWIEFVCHGLHEPWQEQQNSKMAVFLPCGAAKMLRSKGCSAIW